MTDDKKSICGVCGEPMPKGEEMFKIHGYSGPCPKPPLPQTESETILIDRKNFAQAMDAAKLMADGSKASCWAYVLPTGFWWSTSSEDAIPRDAVFKMKIDPTFID